MNAPVTTLTVASNGNNAAGQPTFKLTWKSVDDAAGVKHVTVYVAENGGDFSGMQFGLGTQLCDGPVGPLRIVLQYVDQDVGIHQHHVKKSVEHIVAQPGKAIQHDGIDVRSRILECRNGVMAIRGGDFENALGGVGVGIVDGQRRAAGFCPSFSIIGCCSSGRFC